MEGQKWEEKEKCGQKLNIKVNGVNFIDNDNTIKTLPLSFFAWLEMMQTKERRES